MPPANPSLSVRFSYRLAADRARVLGLQVRDEAVDGRGQTAAFCGLGAEGALHPFGLEPNDPALQRALRDRAGLLRARRPGYRTPPKDG